MSLRSVRRLVSKGATGAVLVVKVRRRIAAVLAAVLVAGLAVGLFVGGPNLPARYQAWAAARSLKGGDLAALETRLAKNRGDVDFAYYFARGLTPRDLGDALGTVAGASKEAPLKVGVDPDAYDLQLTDLAGALAMATHGTGDRALPQNWCADFVTATTRPANLYKVESSIKDLNPFGKSDGEKRRDQDVANKANLLLLLSRGHWSDGFLKCVTRGYYDFDRQEGGDAWPQADPNEDEAWAPAPSGAYLTDGVLALSAALTANSAASEWAFTDFKPGQVAVDGTDYKVGAFTHFLLFDHEYVDNSGKGAGQTSALTALSAAIESRQTYLKGASSSGNQPMQDSLALQAIAKEAAKDSGCSSNPLTYGQCVVAAGKAVWRWLQQWGHLVLKILSSASAIPPAFVFVGVGAALVNATWYAIDGDYENAGLSLAAAVPALKFANVAKSVVTGAKVVSTAGKVAAKRGEIARVAQDWLKVAP